MRGGYLVIGGGIGGQAVCEAVRELDRGSPLMLVCGEPHLPYDRVQLSTLLVDGGDAASLQLRPPDWYRDHDVAVRLGTRVTALDLDAGAASLDSGEALTFDRVVLCTGSDALVPPIAGADGPGVHVFRGPEDCAAIAQAAARAERAAVIGGGLLGLEAAYGVAAQGCPVTVVHLVDRLMERQLDSGAAAMLLAAMAELGVDVRLATATAPLRAGAA